MNLTPLLFVLLKPDTYLWLMAAGCLLLTVVCWPIAWRLRRRRSVAARVSRYVLGLFPLCCWYILLYGAFIGIGRLQVRQVEFVSKDLPAAFDGYRILQFSDVHLEGYDGWRRDILERFVDSINAQRADLIVFTGDLQNRQPSEFPPYHDLLAKLKAPDGICSVLGNHDYAGYADCDDFQKYANCGETRTQQYDLGWTLLTNGYHAVRRGSERIFIAGMENDGEGRFPQLGNIPRSLFGLNTKSFVVMLEHDPTAWRRKILPRSHCQLTLSGHTHGGQFELLGWTPAQARYREYGGMYYMGERALNVSSGLNGVIPIRFGVAPEIVVITLKQKK